MNISREEKKIEAIRRLKVMNYFDQSIKEFEKNDKGMINEPPFGAHFFVDDNPELKKIVDNFESENNCLVYAIIHSFTSFGEMFNLLYVEDYKEEWMHFDEDYEYNIVFAYVFNKDYPDYSEFGSIKVKETPAGGLKRVF